MPSALPATRTPPTGDDPRVSIILLTYNAPYWVERCLRSVFSWTGVPYELIVVDNGSGPETLGVLDPYRTLPGVTIVENGRNEGYARANNIGLERARADLVLFLNSDVIVTRDWLANLIAPLDARREVAATGPRTNHAAGIQGGVFPRSLAERKLDRFAKRFNRPNPGSWREAERLAGFALLVRRSVVDEVGGFDERFDVGTAEDRELCDRIRHAGYSLICAGDCFVMHAGHASFLENQINFKHRHTLNRIAYAGGGRNSTQAPPDPGDTELADGTIITIETGAKYLVHEGALHPISQMEAVRLLPFPVRQGTLAAEVIAERPIGDPIFFVRSWSSKVYLLALGRRHRVRGPSELISGLEGITVLLPEHLDAIPAAEPLEL